MKRFYLLVAFWLLNGLAFAQSDTTFVAQTQAEYDSLFSTLNWSNVPTGVLIDKTMIFTKLDSYTRRDNEVSTYRNWRQMYLEFYNASHNRENLQPLVEVKTNAGNFLEHESKTPLLFLHFKFNRFVPDALKNGLITLDTPTLCSLPQNDCKVIMK